MKKYVLITPARNEERYIEKCLRSVITQTVLPQEWIIVNDCSIDRTEEIVKGYSREYPFIKLLRLSSGQGRDFGSKAAAFNSGYRSLSTADYGFIGSIDADVSFEPDYFERLMDRFEKEKKLGVAGGAILELVGKKYIKQLSGANSVAGAIQFFRRRCFEDIGGYVQIKFGGIDAAAEIMARMKGWDVRSFEWLEVHHHRRVSGSSGVIRSRFRSGMMHYQLGYHPLFQLVSTAYRLFERPFIAGSLLTLLGYCWACVRRLERPVSPGFVDYLKSEQISRVRSIFTIKFS